MRIICPQCRGKLHIHRPSVAATRIKCRNCGHKFYAGKAEELIENPVPRSVSAVGAQAEAQAAVVTAPADEAFDQTRKKKNRAAARVRLREQKRAKRMKWMVPTGIISLVIMCVLGIFFSQRANRPPTQPTNSLFDSPNRAKRLELAKRSPSADSSALLFHVDRATRPEVLVGVWEFPGVPDGVMELKNDGRAMLRGPFVKATPLELETQWFVTGIDGNEYYLEFGPEPFRNENSVGTFRVLDDGQLRLIRFANLEGKNTEPRIFKKKK